MLIFKLEKFRLVRNTLVIERHLTTTIWTRATESLFWMLPFSAVIQYKKGNSPFGFIGLGYFVNLTIIIGFKKNVFLSQ